MVHNVGINSVKDKFNDMDNINKLIENIQDKDLNAVLYGVMLRFLENHDTAYGTEDYSLSFWDGKLVVTVPEHHDTVYYEEIDVDNVNRKQRNEA